jgi:DNA-binding XRE family transcriptional regulator
MIIKNQDKIAEISYLIPPCLNMFGVSTEQNDKVLRKIYGLQLKKMRLMRGYTQTRVAKAISVTFQQIQKYEKGVNAVSVMNELKLAEFLKCDRNYFVQPITENGYKFLIKRGNGYDKYSK